MSWQTWLVAVLIGLTGALQYGLMVYAIRDLVHRPRVRGNNKVVWGLVVLCVPIAGALAYAIYGPTSFRDRPPPPPADPDRRRGLAQEVLRLPDDLGDSGHGAAPPQRGLLRRPTADQSEA
jgi:hypothetical protein